MIGCLCGTPHQTGTAERSPAERLERFLGDPWDHDRVLRHPHGPAGVPLAEVCAHLDAWGLHHYYVPAEHGGALSALPDLLELVRAVARRDPAVAVTHTRTFLGAAGTWVAGDRVQAARLGELVVSGASVALGRPERRLGGGPRPGEVTARHGRGGYLLDGEHWLLDNAAGGRLLCLLARTGPQGGPRGSTLLLVDQQDLDPATFRRLPDVPAVGVAAGATSGVAFHRARVETSARVGAEGQGVELLLRATHLTGWLAPAICLGNADRALRLAVRLAGERGAYGGPRHGHPGVRRALGEGYADLLAMETLCQVAARGVHLAPGEASVTSAAARTLVPTVLGGLLGRLREVFAPQAFPFGSGGVRPFDQMERDHRAVSAYHGGGPAAAYGLVSQFGALARHHAAARERQVPAGVFDLGGPVPAAQLPRLDLVARRGSGLLGTLPESAQELRRAAQSAPELVGPARLAARLAALVEEVPATLARPPRTAASVTEEDEQVAERFAVLLAAAACLGVWRHAEAVGVAWPDALWLHATLYRLYTRLKPGDRPFLAVASPWGTGRDDQMFERLAQRLVVRCQTGEALSLVPFRTAESEPY